MNNAAFTPGPTVTISASATSGVGQLNGSGQAVEIQNAGGTAVFVKLGNAATVAAAATDYPILAGQSKVLSRDPMNQTHLAVVTASGTATVYATTGEGL
jgi:hypothetical protein